MLSFLGWPVVALFRLIVPIGASTTTHTVVAIRTSQRNWSQELASAYNERRAVHLINDAKFDINPRTENLLQMGRKAGLAIDDWRRVCACLGVGGFGVALIVMAIMDPEPTSKLGLIVATGGVLVFGGGFSALSIITQTKPPKVKVTSRGFNLSWNGDK